MLHSSFNFLSTAVTMHIDLKNGSDSTVVFLLTGIGGGLLLPVILSSFNFLKRKGRAKIKTEKRRIELMKKKEKKRKANRDNWGL